MDTILTRLAGALADRYRIEREIGAGGMATVYLARDLKHDRDVALKVLRPELAAALGTERFLQEIRISARLDHPHILTLIDSGESDGFVWYALPYVRGESLRTMLTREKQLSVEDAVRIGTQIAGALDYAHRHGVVHRDIKPENILLHEGLAVVADFGIALAASEAGGDRLTLSGLSLGTPQYMSPEQATGTKDIDARSDVYSLGAMVYEALTGEPPHTGPTVQAVIAKLLTERPTRIRVVRDAVPQAIDDAVAKALAKVPSDRFARAGDFAAALAASPAPAGRPSRRSAWAAAGLAVALLAVVLVIWGPVRQSAPPPAPGAATESPSVAVLPFENLTGNPADQYLSDGMTEEIIGQLARVGGLKVISRTSTEALKGRGLTMRQISDTLGVRHILEGSVRHEGNRIRVAVDLIDASTDANIWTSRYNGELTDVFALQEEIARQVADSLVKTVGVRPTVGRVARSGSPEAYAAYLAGKSMLYRRTREGFRGAVTQFERAIAEDPSYAPSYAGLATTYSLWAFYAYPDLDFYDAYGRALRLADRAIALDSLLADGHAVLARALTRAWAPAEIVEAGFKRAIALQPNSADAHQWYALFLAREGRHTEALPVIERAISLDPLAPGIRIAAANLALTAGRHAAARQEADRTLALEPGLLRARELQAMSDILSHAFDRCLALDLGPYSSAHAMCAYSLGRVREAEQAVDSLRAAFAAGSRPDADFSPVVLARSLSEYYGWTGNAEQSLLWLERAYAISPEGGDLHLIATGLYGKVRDDPRFKAGWQRIRTQIHERVQRARAQPGRQ